MGTPTYSISGSATSWVSLDSGTATVSGTVPAVGSSDTTLVITATTTQPAQTYTQTITFTITEGIGYILGSSVNGVLNISTKHLEVTGTGAMFRWVQEGQEGNVCPILTDSVSRYGGYVQTIHIGDGVTSIGDNFGNVGLLGEGAGFYNLTTVTGGKDVKYIGVNAFGYCGNPTPFVSIDWMAMTSLVTISDNAFDHTELREVIIPNTVKVIGNRAFIDCPWRVIAFGSDLSSGVSISAFSYSDSSQQGYTSIIFTKTDGSTTTGMGLVSDIYIREDGDSYTISSNASSILTATTSNHYHNSTAYLISGKTVPSSGSDDNISFITSTSSVPSECPYVAELVQSLSSGTSSWALSDTIGSVTVGGDETTATLTGGTAPTLSSTTESSSYSRSVSHTVTVSDGNSISIVWDSIDFTIVVTPVLQITSTPPTNDF